MNALKTISMTLAVLLLLALTGLLFVSWSAVGTVGTTLGSDTTGNSPTSLILITDAIVLPTGDGQAVVTAMVRDQAGRSVADADVHFTTNLGSMSPASATTDADGIAASTFTAGEVPGQATVIVECSGLTQTVLFQLGGAQQDIGSLTLQSDVDQLMPGERASVTATVRDQAGNPVSGELITFFGSLGEMAPASGLSDDSGEVTATFTAGSVPGQATITVLAGYASNSVNVQVQASSATPTNTPTNTPMATPTSTPTATPKPTLDHWIYLPVILKNYP